MPGPDRWLIRGLHEWTLSKRLGGIAVGGVDLLLKKVWKRVRASASIC